MSERKLLSYILIIAFFAILIGGGSYFYFVGNPLERFWPTTLVLSPTPTESVPPVADSGAIPVESDLLQKSADIVGVVETIDGRTLTIQTKETSVPYFIPERVKIYLVHTDVISDPPLTEEITVGNIVVGSKVSIYFNDDKGVEVLFVTSQ